MKKFNIKEFVIRIFSVFFLLVISAYIFIYIETNKKPLSEQKILKPHKVKNQNEQREQLRTIERINSYIEEQDFLLSKLEAYQNNTKPILESIEKNILAIEEEAKNKEVENLIDKNKIIEIKNNLLSFEQITNEQKEA